MTPTSESSPRGAPRDDRRSGPERPYDLDRSFAPANEQGAPPAQVQAFGDGRIDQARAGRVLLVCAREDEVGGHNWEPFAHWLVTEVAAANALNGGLILDLRRVRRLSSRGLRALAFGWRELAEDGVIAVCGLSDVQREIFAISQYDRLFEIYDDAIAAWRGLEGRLRR